MVRDYARQIARQLAKLDVDIVFSPQSPNSQPIAYLDCRQPIVTWTDAPWAAVVDFYPEYSSKLVPFHKDYDGLTDPLGEAGWG